MASPILVADTPKRVRGADDAEGAQRAAKRIKYEYVPPSIPLDRGNSKADEFASNIHDFGNIVTILVGPDEQHFLIHQDAICDKSKFFKAACSQRWIEGQVKLVRLPEANVEVFEAYCKWVYSGMIEATPSTREDEKQNKRYKRDMFIDLYLLGDVLDDIQLRRVATCAVFKILEVGGKLPNPDIIAVIWSSTPPGSLFRKQLVDYTVARIRLDTFIHLMPQYPLEFVQEVAVAALRKSPSVKMVDAMGDGSQYLEPEEPEDNTT
jgi:hypothetical protein